MARPTPWRDAALDLAERPAERVEGPADVLGRGDLDHAHQAEVGVDVDHGAVGGARDRHVGVALAVGVERLGRAVLEALGGLEDPRPGQPTSGTPTSTAPDDRHDPAVDDVEVAHRPPRSRRRRRAGPGSRTARHAFSTAPPDIHVWRLADVDPAEPIDVSAGATSTSSTPSTVRAICWHERHEPLTDLGAAHVTVARPSTSRQRAVRVVVVALGVHQVLEADREADAAAHVGGVGRAPGAAGTGHRVVVVDRRRASAARRVARITSATGSVPSIRCPVSSVSPVAIALRSRSSTGRCRTLRRACPSGPRGRSRPAPRRSRAWPARRVVRAHAEPSTKALRRDVRAGGEARGVGDDVVARRA